jgi:hypothetical protein
MPLSDYVSGSFRNGKFFIPIEIGENSILMSIDDPTIIGFTLKMVYDNVDTTSDINTMPVLTEELSEEIYVTGFNCKDDYL